MNLPNLTNKQINELEALFELVSERQIKDFGNISASNKADGSLITSCDLWSDNTIVDALAKIAPNEGVLSEEIIFSSFNFKFKYALLMLVLNIFLRFLKAYSSDSASANFDL